MVSEKYRLEVHWNKVTYSEDGIAKLDGCYLTGPVVNEVAKMNDKDTIKLDFTAQYKIFVPNFYVAHLSWVGVDQKDNRIYLKDVFLKNRNINSVPKLKDTDYLVIDTQNHEDDKHLYNYLYTTYLIKTSGEKYNFNKGS